MGPATGGALNQRTQKRLNAYRARGMPWLPRYGETTWLNAEVVVGTRAGATPSPRPRGEPPTRSRGEDSHWFTFQEAIKTRRSSA